MWLYIKTIVYCILLKVCSALMWNIIFMKLKTILLIFTISALSLFTHELYGQDNVQMRNNDPSRMDSLNNVNKKIQDKQIAVDKETLNNAKEESRKTKTKAKEARRIERDANNASSESRKAVKTEKKAQRARKNADSQSKKALNARDKSDNNN